MSVRQMHIVGDRVVDVAARARVSSFRTHEVAPATPTQFAIDVNGARVTVSPLNVYKRLLNHEALAKSDGVSTFVWAIVHESTECRLTGAAALDAGGQPHVVLVMNHLPCPILRLGVLRHETRHIERGDLGRSLEAEDAADAERDCEAAGQQAIREYVGVVNLRSPHRLVESTCVACFTGKRRPCGQSREAYEWASAVLGAF